MDGLSLQSNWRIDIIKFFSYDDIFAFISYEPEEIFIFIYSKVYAGNGADEWISSYKRTPRAQISILKSYSS